MKLTIDVEPIARNVKLPAAGVQRVIELLDEGNTVPFITRYRKDQTGGLDEQQIRAIQKETAQVRLLMERKETILKSIQSRNQLTPELAAQIRQAASVRQLEDIYLPYKPKKQTLAAIARSRGLEPLASEVLQGDAAAADLPARAADFVDPDKELPSTAEVLLSLGHLIAERYSENVHLRSELRRSIWRDGFLISKKTDDEDELLGNDAEDAESSGATSPSSPDDTPGDEADADRAPGRSSSSNDNSSNSASHAGDTAAAAEPPQASPSSPTAARSGEEAGDSGSPGTAATGDVGASAAELSIACQLSLPLSDSPLTAAESTAVGPREPADQVPPEAAPAAAHDEAAHDEAAHEPAALAGAEPPTSVDEVPVPGGARAADAAVLSEAVAESPGTPVADASGQEALPSTADVARSGRKKAKKKGPETVKPKLRTKANRRDERREARRKKRERLIQSFKDYFDFKDPLKKVPHHRILAINRGERTKVLRVKIEVAEPARLYALAESICIDPAHRHADFLRGCLADALSRLVLPSLEREIRGELRDQAEDHAVEVFARNLRQLLLQSTIPNQRVVAIDPGFRSGCKLVALDECGNLLGHSFIHLVGSEDRRKAGREVLVKFVIEHQAGVIAIGNGAACRETELMVAEAIANELHDRDISYLIVNEAGASVYSTSEVGREELPHYDATVRSSVSIGRRALDPLSELVKIDPASIGVGLYQHDIKQKHLRESLDDVVESCVNYVGVNLNSASPALLRYVSGLNALTARRIYEHRQKHGPFRRREQLKEVQGVGDSTFIQAAGFLKIPDGEDPLDNTWIHPESYGYARHVLEAIKATVDDLRPPLRADRNLVGKASPAPGIAVDLQASGDGTTDKTLAPTADQVPPLPAPDNAAVATEVPGAAGKAVIQEAAPEEAASEDATPKEAVTKEAVTEEVVTEEVVTKEAVTEEVITEEAVPEESVAMEPVTGEPVMSGEAMVSEKEKEKEKEGAAVDIGEVAPAEAVISGGHVAETAEAKRTATEGPGDSALAEGTPEASGSTAIVSPPTPPRGPSIPRTELVERLNKVDVSKLADQLQIGQLLLQDIVAALARPGRDPREDLPPPIFRKGILKLEDLKPGMELTGTVLNVVDFGAFVDIGLVDSGLVHVSRLADRYISDPHDVVSVGDILRVWVVEIDLQRRRASLTAIEPGTERPRGDRPRRAALGGGQASDSSRNQVTTVGGGGDRQAQGRSRRPPRSRPEGKQPRTARSDAKPFTPKPKKKAVPTAPITKAMEEGREPMRTFSDLKQFFEKKTKGDDSDD